MARTPTDDELRRMLQFAGQRLKEAREKRRMSQRDVQQIFADKGQSWLSGIENGHLRLYAHDLMKLAVIYGYPLEYFMDRKWDPRLAQAPQNDLEWHRLYPTDPNRADAHALLDRAYDAARENHADDDLPPDESPGGR